MKNSAKAFKYKGFGIFYLRGYLEDSVFNILSHINNNTHITQMQSAILLNIDIVYCIYCTNILRESKYVYFLFFYCKEI